MLILQALSTLQLIAFLPPMRHRSMRQETGLAGFPPTEHRSVPRQSGKGELLKQAMRASGKAMQVLDQEMGVHFHPPGYPLDPRKDPP